MVISKKSVTSVWYHIMFGIEFFITFRIGMPISAGAMTFYHYAEDDIRQAFDKLKQSI